MKKVIYITVTLIILHLIFNIENCTGQWVQMSNGMGNDKFVNAFTISGNNIFAGTGILNGNRSGVYLSTNNGNTWIQTALNNKIVYALAVSGNDIYAGSDSGVWRSSNNGSNWSQIFLSNVSFFAIAVSGNNIITGSNNGIWLSSNNGIFWLPANLSYAVNSLAVNGNNVFAGTVASVWSSTDNGNYWSENTLHYSIYSFTYGGNKIIAGTSNNVYYSTNNGTNWTQTASINRTIYSLATINNNIFAGTFNNGVYFSSNNGSNWILINQGLGSNPYVMSLLIANNYIFTGTGGQSVWRRPLSEIGIGIKSISSEVPSSFSLSQNYPNPFNPSSIIKFKIKDSRFVTLIVYDILGKEVVTLVNEKLAPGTYEATFAGSNLTSGVYFYRLTTDGFSDTKRMILLK
jgi:photosystem II stability/assembly factor-like uncharacterized protein